ncbi:MAG: hypothetical protein WCP32_04630 [Bacteroidota bacterium]
MKKFFVFSMLSVLLLTGDLFATEVKPIPLAGDDLIVNIKLIFHRPKKDCKSGFGICLIFNMSWEDAQVNNDNTQCLAKGSINERNQLTIVVAESELNKYDGGSALPYFRDKTTIPILDPYPLTPELCRAFGANPPLTIKPGNYPVSFENGVYTVIFQL